MAQQLVHELPSWCPYSCFGTRNAPAWHPIGPHRPHPPALKRNICRLRPYRRRDIQLASFIKGHFESFHLARKISLIIFLSPSFSSLQEFLPLPEFFFLARFLSFFPHYRGIIFLDFFGMRPLGFKVRKALVLKFYKKGTWPLTHNWVGKVTTHAM